MFCGIADDRHAAVAGVVSPGRADAPMIKNTCPNAGTLAPGSAAELTCRDAGLAAAAPAGTMPATSASISANITANLGRIRHPLPFPPESLLIVARAGGTHLQCLGLTQIQVIDEEVEVGLLRVRRVRPARRVVAADLLEYHALAVAGDEPARASFRWPGDPASAMATAMHAGRRGHGRLAGVARHNGGPLARPAAARLHATRGQPVNRTRCRYLT